MTDQTTTPTPNGGDSSGKVEQAKQVAGDAVGRVQDVAGEAGVQAKAVMRDARTQMHDLVDRTRQNVDVEARQRSRQAAGSLRTFADQLGALAAGDTTGAGALGDYARQGRDRLSQFADRLEDGPSAVLDDVRRFARRQPVLFLAAAGAVGFVAGRLLRAGRETSDSSEWQPNRQQVAAARTDALVMPPPDVPPMAATSGMPMAVEDMAQ
jgi:ElaB/YqjD/DUF883 family membrane-anchored ribosome-binding protein